MNNTSSLLIKLLSSNHDRQAFTSGNLTLDAYLRKQAKQDIDRRICKVYVLVSPKKPDQIIGFYSLSTSLLDAKILPNILSRKLPKHPIPAALLGRLAVSEIYHGKGYGKLIVADAIKRVLAISEEIGIYALLVDAIDAKARSFYEYFGFRKLEGNTQQLFLALKSI